MNEITLEQVEEICRKQDNCKKCPLLIKRIVEDDPEYDYHVRIVCYKYSYEKIKEAEKYIKENSNEGSK